MDYRLLAGRPPLTGLEELPWRRVHHAYGAADNLPGELRAFVDTDDERVRSSILWSWYGNIYHQGSRYPATLVAIPVLIDLLRYEGTPERHQLCTLLVHLALGFVPDFDSAQAPLELIFPAMSPRKGDDSAGPGDDPDSDEAPPDGADVERDCYLEVAAGCPLYIRLAELIDQPALSSCASHLLAWFPAHAHAYADRLLAIAEREDADPWVRASALLSLCWLDGGNVAQGLRTHLEARLASPGDPRLDIVRCLVLLRLLARWRTPIPEWLAELARRFAEGRGGDEATPDPIMGLGPEDDDADEDADDDFAPDGPSLGELDEDADEAGVPEGLLAARDQFSAAIGDADDEEFSRRFPWGEPRSLLHQVQRYLVAHAGAEGASLGIGDMIRQLESATDRLSAVAQARSLMLAAFGPSYSAMTAEHSARQLPLGGYSPAQLEVLGALAACDEVWPEAGGLLWVYLDIDFEPRRDELQTALRLLGAAAADASAAPAGADRQTASDASDAPIADSGPPTELTEAPPDEEVIQAALAMMRGFARGRDQTAAALRGFAPYRPYGAAAVPALVALLQGDDVAEARAAAWALGRIGAAARSAAPQLIDALRSGLDVAGWALPDVGVDDLELLRPLLADPEHRMTGLRVLRDLESIPEEFLWEWAEDTDTRQMALAELARRYPTPRLLEQLIEELGEQDPHRMNRAGWLFASCGDVGVRFFLERRASLASAARRAPIHPWHAGDRSLPARFVDEWIAWFDDESDEQVREDLVPLLAASGTRGVEYVLRVASGDLSPAVRTVAINAIATAQQDWTSAERERIAEGLARVARTDDDAQVRTAAIEALSALRAGDELCRRACESALGDPAPGPRRAALWQLSRLGDAGHSALRAALRDAADDRLAADYLLALRVGGASPSGDELPRGPLSASVLAWIQATAPRSS